MVGESADKIIDRIKIVERCLAIPLNCLLLNLDDQQAKARDLKLKTKETNDKIKFRSHPMELTLSQLSSLGDTTYFILTGE